VERRRTTIAASLQARHEALQRAGAGVPAAIVGLLSSSENLQRPNAVGFAPQTDSICALKACKAPLSDCICRQKVFICRQKVFKRQKQSGWAAKPTAFGVRKPSEPLRRFSERGRKLSERASSRARTLLRRSMPRVQCPVQRAQCCPAKHPDGYIEALF